MARAVIAVSEGSGKNIATESRTISSVLVGAQYVLQEETAQLTYSVIARDISIGGSANDHILFIQADSSNYTRIKRILIQQSTLSGAVNTADIRLMRTSTAGSGGTAVSGRPFDAGDTDPYKVTCQTLPTV